MTTQPDTADPASQELAPGRDGATWSWHRRLGWWGYPVLFALAFGSYALGSRFSIFLLDISGLEAIVFLPAGLTVAFLLRLPTNVWWIVLAAVALAEFGVDYLSDLGLKPSIGYALANTVEPLVGAAIVTYTCGAVDLARRRHLSWFTLAAVLIGPALGAAIGGFAKYLYRDGDLVATFLQWWLGDALGVILVGVAILVWGSSPDRRPMTFGWAFLLIAGSSLLTGLLLTLSDLPLVFTVLIGVILTGVVFGIRAVAMTALIVTMTVAATLALFPGELISGISQTTAFLLIKVQVGVFSLAGLMVAAVAAESDRSLRAATDATVRAELLDEQRTQQRDLAMRLQQALLPDKLVMHDGLDVAARYEAASEALAVGGDWYDTIPLLDGKIGLVVGDVVGHGIEALTAMGKVRTAVTALAIHTESPGELLVATDEFMRGPEGSDYATLFYGVLDPATGEMTYASAGHPPPLVVVPLGDTRWLRGGLSHPLYGQWDGDRPEATTRLEQGSLLLLYSDGLVERRGESLESGLDRLERMVRDLRHLSPREICDQVVSRMGLTESRADDLVVVAIKVEDAGATRFRQWYPASPAELQRLRTEVRQWAQRNEVSEPVLEDLLIAVGEAASNAVRHAYRDGPTGDFEVRLRLADNQIGVEVRDTGAWRQADDTPVPGLGIEIIRSLTTDFTTSTRRDGTLVTFSVSAGDEAGI
ncbi:MAG TPA: SpoIIE family protein phosphatase [Acidimicrobiia bacterium]|nr:SpoIIE family protein phosphatase [Acidimicrobiia bacterium]